MDWSGRGFRLFAAGGVGIAALLLALSAGYAAGRADPKYSGPAVLANSGQVTGSVNCRSHDGDPATAAAGVSVWLKGTAFTAHTDDAGGFTMDYVPAGSYELAVITSGRRIRAEVPVVVPAHTTISAGVISVTGGCEGCGGEGGGGGCEGGGGSGGCGGEEGGGGGCEE